MGAGGTERQAPPVASEPPGNGPAKPARIMPWPGPAYEKNCSRDAALETSNATRAAGKSPTSIRWNSGNWLQGEVEQAPAQWFAELCHERARDMDAVRPAATRSCRPRAISSSIRRISRSTPKASSPPAWPNWKPPAGVKSWSTRGAPSSACCGRSIRRKARSPRGGPPNRWTPMSANGCAAPS